MRFNLLCASLAAVAAMPVVTFGNVYPTNLSQSSSALNPSAGDTITLSYLLNEDATGVTIEVLDSSNNVVRTINAGAQSKGSQSALWDGKDDSSNNLSNGNYSFRVNTSGAAHAGWDLISTDGVLNNFELPRGVAVNKNSASPFYGRVYVSNPRSDDTGAGRVMGDGVYMLNADFSDNGIAGGTGHHTGGVDWSLGGNVGPFRLEVGPDDSLYITDWSDAHSGLWQADPNVVAASEILDSTGRNGVGLNATHGSISDVVVTGTGASRTIYSADEDFTPVRSILRYDIGNGPTFSGAPSAVFFDNAAEGGVIINSFNSIAQASDGTFWMSQDRFNGTDEASLIQIDASGNIIYNSLTSLGSPDPLRSTKGIAYDPVNDLIAVVTGISGNIHIFDPDSKTILTTFAFGGGNSNTDVAFDNAGNLYVGNNSAERVRVWSPPNTGFVPNSFSTDSIGPLGNISVIPEPTSLMLMALGLVGLLVASRRAR